MSISSIGNYTNYQTYTQTAAAKAGETSAVSESAQTSKSVFDKLKETFSDINFVTGRDPFASKDVRNNGRNTVYLDADALRKIETDPRYAARVFATIESNKEIIGKGFTYTENGRTSSSSPQPINLSFYGKGEGSKLVATSYTYTTGSSNSNKPSLFGESPSKALFRKINDISNRDLKKWFDAFNVSESERVYFNLEEAWSKLQAAQMGIKA